MDLLEMMDMFVDCSDSITGICKSVIRQNVYIKYVQILVLLCSNQAVKKQQHLISQSY